MPDRSESVTDDTLFAGGLVCRQPRHGYRFSIDAVLAAHFFEPGPGTTILDLGCGCGIISLIIAYRNPSVSLEGIEIQEELYNLAMQNVLSNNLADRLTVQLGNYCQVSELIKPETFDFVVVNPPYRQQGRGRQNPDDQKAVARHEINTTLEDVVRAAAFAVKNRGRVVVVFPAARSMTLISTLKKYSLEPKKIQNVYSYPGSTCARLVLIEAVKNGGEEVLLLPPFYIYTGKNGPYTDEMQQLYT